MTSAPEAPLPLPQEQEIDTALAEFDPSQPLTNIRHERFARELAAGASAAEAYRLAGYEHNEGNCIRLKGNERVEQRTSYLMQKTAQKLEISSDRIMQELALIGFARMQDYVPVLTTGDLTSITSEQSAAISEITVHTDRNGNQRAKLKLAAKREALVDLGKAVGLFDDRPDLTIPVTFIINRGEPPPPTIEHEDEG